MEKHIPVLLNEILNFADIANGENRIIDCTLGYGGHSEAFLQNEKNQLIGIDRDFDALKFSKERLDFAKNRIYLKNGSYSEMSTFAEEEGWDKVDVILMDLGISSPQIDTPERGFSHRFDGPLDMRMSQLNPMTASRIINHYSVDQLARIFRDYGDIIQSKKLARAVVEARKEKPFSTTTELRLLCEDVLGVPRKKTLPKATLCFQALRIEVNEELKEVKTGVTAALKLLKPGGKLLVISFHSLEDRIVKDIFRSSATDCLCPPGLPICVCEHRKSIKILTKKPIVANNAECRINKRANCAKLRIAQKL